MCVGIPGQIIGLIDPDTDMATVSIAGVRRAVNIACLLGDGRNASDCIGDWVLVHVGFAMSRIDEAEALKTLQLLEELGAMDHELQTMSSG